MSKTETFSNSVDLAVVNEYDKDAVILISNVPGYVYHVVVEGSSEMEVFRHLSGHIFGGRSFGNTRSMWVIFFSKYLKFNIHFKNAAKN